MRRLAQVRNLCSWLGVLFLAGGLLAGCGSSSSGGPAVDQPPQVSVTPSKTTTEGQPLLFSVVASDPDSGTILHYTLQNSPPNATIDSLTGAFSWTPTYDQIGIQHLTFVVSDGQKSATATMLVTVAPDPAVDSSLPLPGGTLDPLTIPKYVTPLVIPPVMNNDGSANDYQVAVRQFRQQILPGGLWDSLDGRTDAFPPTTVWGYGPNADPAPDSSALGGGAGIAPAGNSQFNYPGYTIETRADTPVKVRWINDLVDANGNYLPSLFTVDQTLHWANPPQDCAMGGPRTNCEGDDPNPYTGPVPIVTHLHGAHVDWTSDGYPEAWWLPAANNMPVGYATKGGLFGDSTGTNPGTLGYADYNYRNDQPATTLWYHDHALGMTRTNVYAGLAGFWLIRGDHVPAGGGTTVIDAVDDQATAAANDGVLPGPAPVAGDSVLALNSPGNPLRNAVREIPIVIQDRSFNADGSFFYPDNRAFFEGLDIAHLLVNFAPNSDMAPEWNPEAFFNVMVVNGVSWPKLDVAQAQYRFRLLNGCNSRTLNLAMFVVDPATGRIDKTKEVPFYMIGSDQGQLPLVVRIKTGFAATLPGDGTVPPGIASPAPDPDQALLMGPAERPDVIVDFSGLPDGTVVRMVNTAPDSPFQGFNNAAGEAEMADPLTTGQVMEFVVKSSLTGASPTDPGAATPATAPANLVMNPEAPLGSAIRERGVSLNELESDQVCAVTGLDGSILQLDVAPGPNFLSDCASVGGAPYGPRQALLGTVDLSGPTPAPVPLRWTDNSGVSTPANVLMADGSTIQVKVTENPRVGDTEEWQIYNFTEDAHPMHLHLVRFEVVGRTAMDGTTPSIHGEVQPWEEGYKDMVIAYPGEITTIKAKFDLAGLYVWHCHILEHEDNEMMRPYVVSPAP